VYAFFALAVPAYIDSCVLACHLLKSPACYSFIQPVVFHASFKQALAHECKVVLLNDVAACQWFSGLPAAQIAKVQTGSAAV
jgi:hypothetical protein